jgi:BirA family transcriptional regulator, biotin operon repressor / biotin---[acetyl-CoA-carboxylase] ligase
VTSLVPAPEAGSRFPGWEGASAERWAADLGLPLLELHPRLSSTNDRLRELAAGGAPPFTTVVAHTQTRGRGRAGRRWHSPSGTGLWISILLPPSPEGDAGVTTLAVGIAAAEAVEAVAGGRVLLKWPNDLLLVPEASALEEARLGLIRGQWGKLGGILCERQVEVPGTIAGVGINLLLDPEAPPEAIGVSALSPLPLTPSALAVRLLERLRDWADPPPARVDSALRTAWDARDVLRGVELVVEGGLRGAGAGLAEDGSLWVRHAAGALHPVRGGTVRWIEDQGSERGNGGGRHGA